MYSAICSTLQLTSYTFPSNIHFHLISPQLKTYQISAVYKADSFSIPGDYKGTVTHFVTLLNKASADKPLRIFLDAIDQLAPEDGALGLSWLPLDLPPHVKLIVSTSSEVEYGCYPVLQSLLAKCPGNFIEVIISAN